LKPAWEPGGEKVNIIIDIRQIGNIRLRFPFPEKLMPICSDPGKNYTGTAGKSQVTIIIDEIICV